MLILDAKIYFDKAEDSPNAISRDLRTDHPIRPAINFGNGLLFTGTLITYNNVPLLLKGIWYHVMIEMPTIENVAFELIKDIVSINNDFMMQLASRVIGHGKILGLV